MDERKKKIKPVRKIKEYTAGSVDEGRAGRDQDPIEPFRKRIAELSQSKKMLEQVNESMRLEIEKVTQDRRLVSGKLLEMLEEDRREVAMMLYDHAGQVLIALKMDLEELEQGELGGDHLKNLDAAKKKASDLIELIRKTSRKLRPSVLDNLGLVPATRSLVNHFEKKFGMQIDFFYAGMEERLAPDKETALFRILQESLENSIRYAAAGRIYISLIKREDRVLLTIEDDGNGFDYKGILRFGGNEKDAAGIALMRERSVQAGGEFWIESQPGRGTTVMAELPAD